MDSLVKKNFFSVVSWAAITLWCIIIFTLSSQPAVESNGLSEDITIKIIDAVDQWLSLNLETSTSADLVGQLNHFIRKFAHGGSYFIMGLLSVNAFIRTVRKDASSYGFSALFCILLAISDEVHQLFVPGRSGEIRDVLIDSTGALLAIGVCWGIRKLGLKRRQASYLSNP